MSTIHNSPSVSIDSSAIMKEIYTPKIWSRNGRIGRLHLVLYLILITYLVFLPLSYLVITLMFPIFILFGSAKIVAIACLIILGLIYTPIIAAVLILLRRRCHDLNRSGWEALLIFVPIVNLFLFFAPGSKGRNKFGPAPSVNSIWINIAALVLLILPLSYFAMTYFT